MSLTGMFSKYSVVPLFFLSVITFNATAGSVTSIISTGAGSGGPRVLSLSSFSPTISADNRFVAFSSFDSRVVSHGDTNAFADIFVRDRQTGVNVRVSVSSEGLESNGNSSNPVISGNGRFIVFSSEATNLVANDTNGLRDIFVHDTQTSETSRVNIDSNGIETINTGFFSNSFRSDISNDGRFVVFSTAATNLVENDTNNLSDVFLHDRNTGITVRVSENENGDNSNGDSTNPSISPDGRYVAFQTSAGNLVNGENDNALGLFTSQVVLKDLETGAITRVNKDANGQNTDGSSFTPDVSTDGRFIAFISTATNLTTGDTNGVADAFVYDRALDTTSRISVDSNGTESNGQTFSGISISDNGRFVTYISEADNLVDDDTNELRDVFKFDRRKRITTRESVRTGGTQGVLDTDIDGLIPNTDAAISPDGRLVAFASAMTNLITGDVNDEITDVFTRGVPIRSKNEFTSDLKSDVLIRNDITGLWRLNPIDGRSVLFDENFSRVDITSDQDWMTIAIADFTGDRVSDVLLRNTVTGRWLLNPIDGKDVVQGFDFGDIPELPSDLDWQPVAVANFSRNAFQDVLLRNTITGRWILYPLQGRRIPREGFAGGLSFDFGSVPITSDLDWQVAGVADFNGDFNADLLLRNSTTGRWLMIPLDGRMVLRFDDFGGVGITNDLTWDAIAAKDFTGDGLADVLLRNSVTGQWLLIPFNGRIPDRRFDFGGIGVLETNLDWVAVEVEDFTGDGLADILLRNNVTGAWRMHPMDGKIVVQDENFGGVPITRDLSWQPQ